VIVGGGVAGHRAALELRRLSPDARIWLLGSEPGLPYDRPALTKSFLLDRKSPGDILLKDADAYRRLDVRYLAGTGVDSIDAGNHVVRAGKDRLDYDALLLATGSRARRLAAGIDAGDGLYLRTLADARSLSDRLRAEARVVVIGGGFIGLEVAAAARARGCEVTVVEAREKVMSRGMPSLASAYMSGLHETNGVAIRCGETVRSIRWRSAAQAIVELGSAAIAADLVVYGLGVEPNVELARAIGLEVDDGIVVDAGCRTSDPAIFAAGEVTCHPSGRSGRRRRIESWRVASDQAVVAATNMAGGDAAYTDSPWLWSDQYDVNLQALGDALEGTAQVLAGRIEDKKWTMVALDADGRPVGAVAVNNGRDISMLRRAMASGAPLPGALAAICRPLSATPERRHAEGGLDVGRQPG
jgi:NADPH-dependent 2,4-dienoyl-CoA reductase/sulfur reductase-like enzyme